MAPSSGSANSIKPDESVNPSWSQAARPNRSSSLSGRPAASCISCPIEAVGGISIASATVSIVALDLAARELHVLRQSSSAEIDKAYLSVARAIEFPTERSLTAHAFFYPPSNADYQAPESERPPLIVISHGGPTHAS